AEHGARAGVLAHEPQPPATAGEELLGELLEVLRRRRERLLERLADLAVGVADQAVQLAQRRFEGGAPALQLLDVRERLLVLLLRGRVGGPELLAAAREALDPLRERGALGVRQRLRRRLRLQAERLRERAQLGAGLAGAVARLLGADLSRGDRLAVAAQAPL